MSRKYVLSIGERVYLYKFNLNLKRLNKIRFGTINYIEDIREEDWMDGPDFESQNIYIYQWITAKKLWSIPKIPYSQA